MMRVSEVQFGPSPKSPFLASVTIELQFEQTTLSIRGFVLGLDKQTDQLYLGAPISSQKMPYGWRTEHLVSFDNDSWRQLSAEVIRQWKVQHAEVQGTRP